jgi:hypothetical protein
MRFFQEMLAKFIEVLSKDARLQLSDFVILPYKKSRIRFATYLRSADARNLQQLLWNLAHIQRNNLSVFICL